MEDPYIACPFNKVHRIPQSRIQRHIVKCPDKGPNHGICPYNATHIVLDAEMKLHTEQCTSKPQRISENIDSIIASRDKVPKITLQRSYLPETDPHHEIWDD